MKHRRSSHFLWIVLWMITLGGLNGQGALKLDTINSKIGNGISTETARRVVQSVELALNQYADYSTLFDRQEKEVNAASVNRFLSLFDAAEAALCQDYLFDSTSNQVDVNDYFIPVLNGPARTTGLEAVVSAPKLVEMSLGGSENDQILSKVVVTKVFKNYLDDNGTGYYLSPVRRTLVLTFKTPSYYLEEALITAVAYYTPVQISGKQAAPGRPAVAVASGCSLFDENTEFPDNYNEDTLRLIEQRICNALALYTRWATLRDTVTNTVTASSGSLFQQLFASGASLHLSDYKEYPEIIEVAEYREDVFKFLKDAGVEFSLSNTRIKSVVYDPDGFYYIKVLARKEVPAYLDDQTFERRTSGRARVFDMEMDYILVERTMEDPLLERVISTTVRKPETKRSFIAFGPNVSLGFSSGTPVDGYAYVTDQISFESSLGPGFQVDLLSNFFANHRAYRKPLFLAVGVGYQSFVLEAEASNVIQESEILTIDNQTGMQSRELNFLQDRVPMKLLSVPIGLEYSAVRSADKKFEWMLGGKIVPSLALGSESSFDADGFYGLAYPQYGFSFYNDSQDFMLNPADQIDVENLYGIGAFRIDDSRGSDFASKFLLGYRVESSFLLSLSANFKFNLRLAYTGMLGDVFVQSSQTPDFPLEEDMKPLPNQVISRNTLFEDYFTDVNLRYLSVSVGLAYLLNQ